jgi:hypothetical protein
MSDTGMNYLRDLVGLIVEKSKEAKQERDSSNSDYDIGRLMAYHEVVSLIQQQAEVFDLSYDEIGMPQINPEIDLL